MTSDQPRKDLPPFPTPEDDAQSARMLAQAPTFNKIYREQRNQGRTIEEAWNTIRAVMDRSVEYPYRQ